MIKAIASDFDGTLCFKDFGLYETDFLNEDIKAIQKFQAAGGLFGICTGRPLGYIERLLEPAGIYADFYITTTGAVILNQNKEILFEKQISHQTFQSVYDKFKEYPMYIHADYKLFQKESSLLTNGTHIFRDEDEFKSKKIFGMSIVFPDDDVLIRSREFLEAQFPDLCVFQNTNVLDVIPRGCTKGIGIQFIKAFYHIDQMTCIGDTWNDIPMLQEADVAYTFFRSEEITEYADTLVETIADAIEDLLALENKTWEEDRNEL